MSCEYRRPTAPPLEELSLTCALNRPFDDQSQPRIRLEAEAVEHLLRAVDEGGLEWVSSEVVLFEILKTPDMEVLQ